MVNSTVHDRVGVVVGAHVPVVVGDLDAVAAPVTDHDSDPAHDADMAQLRRKQLRADISPAEAEAELREAGLLDRDDVDDRHDDWGDGDPDEYTDD
jgi:hypothetical protein